MDEPDRAVECLSIEESRQCRKRPVALMAVLRTEKAYCLAVVAPGAAPVAALLAGFLASFFTSFLSSFFFSAFLSVFFSACFSGFFSACFSVFLAFGCAGAALVQLQV